MKIKKQSGKLMMKKGGQKAKGETSAVTATSRGAGNHAAVGEILKKKKTYFLDDSCVSSTLSPHLFLISKPLKCKEGCFLGLEGRRIQEDWVPICSQTEKASLQNGTGEGRYRKGRAGGVLCVSGGGRAGNGLWEEEQQVPAQERQMDRQICTHTHPHLRLL